MSSPFLFNRAVCKRRKSNTTIQEPLALLEAIGALEKLEDAKFGGPVTCSASYAVPDAFLEAVGQTEVHLTPNVAKKRKAARQRKEARLNRKYRWHQALSRDLAKIGLDPMGFRKAWSFLKDEKKASSARTLLEIVAREKEATMSVATCGTIWNSFGQCLRELKPHLLLEGAPVSLCDISHAHFCLLPLLLSEEIKSQEGDPRTPAQRIEAMHREVRALREFLGTGDIYCELSGDPASPKERQKTKEKLMELLNWKNVWARGHPLFERLRSRFPFTLRVVESIKQKDHRAISRSLRHYTAHIINEALIRCQERGIAAVPDTDSIICPAAHREVVCQIIGEEMHKLTGICCLVGGRRYDPGEA